MFGPFYPQTILRACLVTGMRLLVGPANNIMPPKWTFGPFYPQTILRACLVSGMRLLVGPANNIMPPKWTFEIVAWAKQFS